MRELVRKVERVPGAETGEAAARSQLYLLLSESFRVPDPEAHEDVRSGQVRSWILEAADRLPYPLELGEEAEGLTTEADYESFNSEFMRLFELGAPGPPCPLNESGYLSGQTAIFKELVSFYNFFDLSVSKARELPDHLRIELDFMHFLTFQEVERSGRGWEAGPLWRAQRDFQTRHLGRWVPVLHRRVVEAGALEFFRSLTTVLERFGKCEGRFLARRLEGETG